MRELKCNNCGGTDIIMKADGKFLCESCGVTYTKDQKETIILTTGCIVPRM